MRPRTCDTLISSAASSGTRSSPGCSASASSPTSGSKAAATTRWSTTRSGSRSGGCCWSASSSAPCRGPGRAGWRWSRWGCSPPSSLWTALSLTWTESTERTAAELARALTYLGVLRARPLRRGTARTAAAGRRGRRRRSSWSPSSPCSRACTRPGSPRPTRPRTSSPTAANGSPIPLNYWNGLAALIAIGLPLVLHSPPARRQCSSAPSPRRPCRRCSLAALLHPLAGRHRRRRDRGRGLPGAHRRPRAEAG